MLLPFSSYFEGKRSLFLFLATADENLYCIPTFLKVLDLILSIEWRSSSLWEIWRGGHKILWFDPGMQSTKMYTAYFLSTICKVLMRKIDQYSHFRLPLGRLALENKSDKVSLESGWHGQNLELHSGCPWDGQFYFVTMVTGDVFPTSSWFCSGPGTALQNNMLGNFDFCILSPAACVAANAPELSYCLGIVFGIWTPKTKFSHFLELLLGFSLVLGEFSSTVWFMSREISKFPLVIKKNVSLFSIYSIKASQELIKLCFHLNDNIISLWCLIFNVLFKVRFWFLLEYLQLITLVGIIFLECI